MVRMTKSRFNSKFKFTPLSKKQLQVLFWWESPKYKDKFAIICDGSVRAGKTVIMSISYVRWAMKCFNGQSFILAGKTIGSLRRNVVRVLKQMLASEGYLVNDNNSENVITIAKGGKINYFFLFGGKDEASQDLVQGMTAAGAFFDEVALMPESFVAQATARLSVEGAKAWFNCNPESPYHWFKVQWIDKLSNKNALQIHFLMEDNPSLSSNTIKRYKTMYSGVFYERYILGLWSVADGVVYDNFNRETMVVDDSEVPQHFDKYIAGVDWGYQHQGSIVVFGLTNDDKWYLLEEHTEQYKEIDYWTDIAHELQKKYGKMMPFYCDTATPAYIDHFYHAGINAKYAWKSVIPGIEQVSIQINTGKFFVKKSAPVEFLNEIYNYQWDDKNEDAVIKEKDHVMDAMRYCIATYLHEQEMKSYYPKTARKEILEGMQRFGL